MKKGEKLKTIKKPWPTKDAMEQVYANYLWGTNGAEFYSGEGSHQSEIIQPYISIVKSFLTAFEKPITVCDLGCGDFNVGKSLVSYTNKYVGVDIVEDLIAHNKKTFTQSNLEFKCLDIAVDDLPMADCALVRQVLQHLSNAEIQNIVQKLAAFKYVILTEHLPKGNFVPNIDIISGQGTRLKKQSGVDLMEGPFHFKVNKQKLLLSSPVSNGRIVTTLYMVY